MACVGHHTLLDNLYFLYSPYSLYFQCSNIARFTQLQPTLLKLGSIGSALSLDWVKQSYECLVRSLCELVAAMFFKVLTRSFR